MHRPQSAKLSEQLSLRLLEGILSVARLSDLQGLLFDEIEQVVPCIGKLFLHRQDSENLTVSQYTFGEDLKNISEVYSQFSPNLSEDEFRLFRQVLESEVPLLVEKGSLDDADNFTRERFDWWQLESVLYIPLADAVIVLFSRHPILRSQVTEIQLISSLLAARINESIEHERLQQEKERILIARKSYQRMLKLTEKINYLLSLDEFFDFFMGELLEIFGFEIAGVQLEENGLLPPRHWKTVNSELEAKTREVMNYFADLGNAYKIDPPEGGSCYTYLNNKHMYVPDFSALAGLPMKPKDAIVMEMLDIKIKSIIQVPIRKSGSPVGVLQMWSFSHEVCLSENDIDTIYSICSIIPSIIRNSELYSTVAAQKEMLDFQHQELQEKNREVLDSIAYARRLQLNSLPSDSLLDQVIPQRVLIWLPRDIVGGDMYWVVSSGVFQYLAVFDCTGHGVPGAF
ncbi:MAG: hypothetical protein D6B26_03515, partial [Spirochaetaceae bacterium]